MGNYNSYRGESVLCCELHRAAQVCRVRPVLEGKQEVHDLPDFGEFSDPFAELLHVCLQPFERRILWVFGVPPECPDGFQQLPGHQGGEVGRPQLADTGDGDAAVAAEGEVPLRELERLGGEVEPAHGFVRQEQTLTVLTLLSGALQGRHSQTHHLQGNTRAAIGTWRTSASAVGWSLNMEHLLGLL